MSGAATVAADAQQRPGTTDSGLDLIGDEEYVPLAAGGGHGGEVIIGGDKYTGLPLDGLNQYPGDGGRVIS